MLNFKIYNSFSKDLKNDWKSLEKDSNIHLFQTYDWSKYWFEKIGKSKFFYLKIICIYESKKNTPVILLPFVLKNFFSFNFLFFLGGSQNDYNDIIIKKSFKLNNRLNKKIQNYLLSESINFDFLLLSKIKFEYNNNNNNNNSLFGFKSIESNKSFESELLENFESFISNVKNKVLNDTKRQIRRLNILGDLKLIHISNKDYEKNIKIMIDQKIDRLNMSKSYNYLSEKSIRFFYSDFYKENFDSIKYDLSILKLNNDVIATHWGLIFRNKYYYLMPTFNFEYSKYSPGKIMTFMLINYCYEKEYKIFDFTIGNESYKKDWSNKSNILYEIYFAKTFKGKIIKFIYINYLKYFHNKFKSLKKIILNILKV